MYLITSSVQIPPFDAQKLVDLAKCQVNTICVGDGLSDLLADIAKCTGGKHGKINESVDAYKVMRAVDMVCDTKVVATCLKVNSAPCHYIMYEGVSVYCERRFFPSDRTINVTWFDDEKKSMKHSF